ncbi:Beta-lactamase-like [Mycobacteroides abscessus]|nr:Beta-lactamase-like [Mycobacteroides abscessus]
MLGRGTDNPRATIGHYGCSMTSITIDDDYTGHVEPGSGVARRTVDGATIIKASVGPMDNNAYIVTCAKTGKSLLIDAANDAERLAALVDENTPDIELIVTPISISTTGRPSKRSSAKLNHQAPHTIWMPGHFPSDPTRYWPVATASTSVTCTST